MLTIFAKISIDLRCLTVSRIIFGSGCCLISLFFRTLTESGYILCFRPCIKQKICIPKCITKIFYPSLNVFYMFKLSVGINLKIQRAKHCTKMCFFIKRDQICNLFYPWKHQKTIAFLTIWLDIEHRRFSHINWKNPSWKTTFLCSETLFWNPYSCKLRTQ